MELIGNVGYSVFNQVGRIYMSNGVATFGTDDGRAYITPPQILDFNKSDWSPWGEDNLMPLEIAAHIEGCPALFGSLMKRTAATVGKGPQPFHLAGIDGEGKYIFEWLDDSEILDWLEGNDSFNLAHDLVYDRNGYGWNTGSYILNKGRDRINRMRRIDVATARLAKKNPEGMIENIFLSDDWEQTGTSYDPKKQAKIRLLRENFEMQDLQKLQRSTKELEFAFANRKMRNARSYYPFPGLWSAREWIKLARNVPALKNSFFTQAVIAQYVISISEKYFEVVYGTDWKDNHVYDVEKRKAERAKVYKGIDDHLTGKDNAYKSICTGTFYDEHTGKELPYVTITEVPKSKVSGEHLPDTSAANQEIHYAVGVNTAATGAGNGGGPYANNNQGSNVRESQSTLIMDTEADRREICSELMVVAKFNGWQERLAKQGKRLTFAYVSNLLTTLDTGKSTKPETV